MLSRLRGTVERLGYLGTAAIVLAIGAYQGIQTEVFTVDLLGLFFRIATVEAVPSTVVFSLLVTLSGIMLAHEIYTETDPEQRRLDGPRVAAIIPVYRDHNVLHESVETLLESNYENLEIAIVGEPGDERTLSVAQEYAEAHANIQVLENQYPGSKANAVNNAVERLDAEYFCTFDADERIDPDFVPIAMYQFLDRDKDVFQARRVPRVSGPVEALAYCERLLVHAGYKLVEPLGFTFCRSSSTAFTRTAFTTVNGFDDLLTEDIDFAHKCFRAGLAVQQARNVTTEMEAPHTLRDLWGQRKRWRLGHIEVLFKALRGNYAWGGLRGKMSTVRIMMSLATSIFLVMLTAKVIVLAVLDLEVFFLLPFVAIALTVAPAFYRDYTEGHVTTLTPAMFLVPIVYPGLGFLTIRCAFEYLLSWEGEWYQVEKVGS